MAARYGVRVVLVSEQEIGAPFESWLTKLVAGEGMVSEVVLSQAGERDIVVTDDADLAEKILLAGRCARVLNMRGQRWTAQGLHPKLPDNMKGNNRLRFEAVLQDEVVVLLKGDRGAVVS